MTDTPAALRHVSYAWPSSGTQACRNISLDIRPGSVRALVGENGAGKTTLGHILAGVCRPDSGRLAFRGLEIDLAARKGRGGIIDGIGLVRQRSDWPGSLALWEAAVLGRDRGLVRRSVWLDRFEKTARDWGVEGLDPRRPVSRTDAATTQRAQVVAALMFDPGILILDEPASAWEEGRSGEFFGLLDRLKSAGRAVLLITHRIEDVFRTAQDVTVLRHGESVMDVPIAGLSQDDVTRVMFGRPTAASEGGPEEEPPRKSPTWSGEGGFGAADEVGPEFAVAGAAAEFLGSMPNNGTADAKEQPPRLSARGLWLRLAGRDELKGIDFDLAAGEILAIVGLREEGLARLEDLVTGNLAPTTGRLRLNGAPAPAGAAGMREAGLHYVPSDVFRRGASLGSTVAENMMVLESRTLSVRGWLHPGRVRDWTEDRRRSGNITGRADQRLAELSGGNIQKVILQRELKPGAGLVVLADPTRGLDEMGRRTVHRRIRDLSRKGTAVLLLASDLDEALDISHRMAVLSGGSLSPIRSTYAWNRIEAARLIAGKAAV